MTEKTQKRETRGHPAINSYTSQSRKCASFSAQDFNEKPGEGWEDVFYSRKQAGKMNGMDHLEITSGENHFETCEFLSPPPPMKQKLGKKKVVKEGWKTLELPDLIQLYEIGT